MITRSDLSERRAMEMSERPNLDTSRIQADRSRCLIFIDAVLGESAQDDEEEGKGAEDVGRQEEQKQKAEGQTPPTSESVSVSVWVSTLVRIEG